MSETATETAEDVQAVDTPSESASDQEQAEHAEVPDTDAAQADDSDDDKGDRSEAKLRKRAQAAEAERDTLATTVESLRKTIAETALEGILAKPSSLWMTGAAVSDYYGEDGTLDADKLKADAQAAIRAHGIGSARKFQGSADGGPREGATKPPSWSDVIEAGKKAR